MGASRHRYATCQLVCFGPYGGNGGFGRPAVGLVPNCLTIGRAPSFATLPTSMFCLKEGENDDRGAYAHTR
jgi:hypothetical protein